jgi:hypothetical protein
MQFQKPIFKAVILWSAVTLMVIVSSLWLNNKDIFDTFIQTGPNSILGQNLMAALIVWLLFGLTLLLIHLEKLNKENIFTYTGFLLVSLLYINLLRERTEYGDLEYYLDAATQLYKNHPLPNGYLYLPFWAAVLEPFVKFGKPGVMLASWLMNVASIMVFYFLLISVLRRYNFSNRLAVLITVLFALVNVPALRTLYYGQVNLHMVNFTLLALVLYPRQRFLSALALAVAVHLKVSPIIIAFVFLLERDWRWLLYFGISLALVGAIPVLTDGITPYYDFLRNSQEVIGARDINFREGSIDAVFLALYNFNFISLTAARITTYTVKALVLGMAFFTMFRNVRNKTFYTGTGEIALNAMPVMLLMLNLASPLVWEHHGVFLTLPFLILLKKINTTSNWLFFALTYTAQFLMPTFDYYPWSMLLRLSAPLLVLWIIYRTSSDPKPAPAFEKANHWLTNLH